MKFSKYNYAIESEGNYYFIMAFLLAFRGLVLRYPLKSVKIFDFKQTKEKHYRSFCDQA